MDRSVVGRVSAISEIDIERIPLRLFARAIGETNPVFFDSAAARAAGYPDVVAPPTYVVALEGLTPPSGVSPAELGLPLDRLLHGEQSMIYLAPLYAGDRVRLQSRVLDVYDKKGGAMQFVEVETTTTKTDGTVAVRSKCTYIVRNS